MHQVHQQYQRDRVQQGGEEHHSVGHCLHVRGALSRGILLPGLLPLLLPQEAEEDPQGGPAGAGGGDDGQEGCVKDGVEEGVGGGQHGGLLRVSGHDGCGLRGAGAALQSRVPPEVRGQVADPEKEMSSV